MNIQAANLFAIASVVAIALPVGYLIFRVVRMARARPVEVTAAVAFVVLLGVHAALYRVTATNTRLSESIGTMEIASSVPDSRVLRMLALGHEEAMADLVWLNALSFYGKYRGLDDDVAWLDPHILAIADLDPKFRLVFEWAGAAIMYGGRIDNESVMAANRFLEMGVERFPFDWSLRMMLGVNYAYELIPTTPEEELLAEEWRNFGAEQIAIAAGLPNAPPSLQLAAATMARLRDGWADEVIGLREQYYTVGAPQARAIRRHISVAMLAVDAERAIRGRHFIQTLSDHPEWGVRPGTFMLTLHPDPVRLFSTEDLTPLPFELTR